MKIEKKREREKRQLMNETMKVRIEFIFQLCKHLSSFVSGVADCEVGKCDRQARDDEIKS